MQDTIREVVAVFDDAKALDEAVFALETRGFDRAAFSLLGSEAAVKETLGHRYKEVKELEDNPRAPRETFFSRVSLLEAEYLPAPILASIGALGVAGTGAVLPVLAAAGTGALLGAALGRVMHQHQAKRVHEQLEGGGLLLWVNVRNAREEATALDGLCEAEAWRRCMDGVQRYLAELAWAPDAILLNTGLHWREDGPDKLAVSAGPARPPPNLLSLDSEGRIAGASRRIDRVRPKPLSCRRRGKAVSPTTVFTTRYGFLCRRGGIGD
jgi:hypothetical protein